MLVFNQYFENRVSNWPGRVTGLPVQPVWPSGQPGLPQKLNLFIFGMIQQKVYTYHENRVDPGHVKPGGSNRGFENIKTSLIWPIFWPKPVQLVESRVKPGYFPFINHKHFLSLQLSAAIKSVAMHGYSSSHT